MDGKGFGRGPLLKKYAYTKREIEQIAKFLIKEKTLELTELTASHSNMRAAQQFIVNGNRDDALKSLKRAAQALERLSRTLVGEEKIIERLESV